MREIKFRYRHKSTTSDFVAVDLVTLEELYRGEYMAGLREVEYWQFLSRDEYTGLTDRKGKEIYEGDLMRYHNENNGKVGEPMEVTYKNGRFWCSKYDNSNLFGAPSFCNNFEVIGNIYENLDLLNV